MAKSNGYNKQKITLKDRFLYWFDNRMANGSLGLIRFLIAASIILALIVAGLIIAFGFASEDGKLSVIWDSIATVINAWMPFFDDGEGNIGYLILMTITAIAGVLFTSVLIGIVTSAIEERIIDLKRGNSRVIESGHTVVLGFVPGEYTLINQLILAAAGKPGCVVIGADFEREDLEQYIKDNIQAPKNFKIICRTVDILDPSSIEKCSVDTCKTIIIHPSDDANTVKAILAVSALMHRLGKRQIPVNAIISKMEYSFPPSLATKNNITALQTNNTLAKMIAHSCTQIGLSETFKEIFNFEGSELYIIDLPDAIGLTISDLIVRLDYAVPVGICRKGHITLNPTPETQIEDGDRIVIFAENASSYKLVDEVENGEHILELDTELKRNITGEKTDSSDTVILGRNESLPIILKELPLNVHHVYLAGKHGSKEEQRLIESVAEKRDLTIRYFEGNLLKGDTLYSIAKTAEHIIILNDYNKSDEEADLETIFLLLNLRELRIRYGFNYNITAEMRREHNQNLVAGEDNTDFLVASSMSSLFLAQLAENPELIEAFSELLSNEGSELYLKDVTEVGCEGTYTVRELRRFVSAIGGVLFGIRNADNESLFNLPLDAEVELTSGCSLIVLSEN